jgi:nucleoside-diphosphate-sugar epimerase
MRILVLGGSVFLSRAVAEEAVRRGHDVTCANRGASGSVPDGAAAVVWDRTGDAPPELARSWYDAVVDVARMPSWVRRGVAAWPDAHWVFVSTVSVYDLDVPAGPDGRWPLLEARHDDVDLRQDLSAYGPMKVACEEVVRAGTASATVVRPGLIGGPGDPSGRFTYWPARLAEGGDVLAGGLPTELTQVIDVRDLAAWIVTLAEERREGTLDAVGQATPFAELVAQVADGVGAVGAAEAAVTWVPDEFLTAQGVTPWMGPESLPMWIPRSAPDDPVAAIDAGPAVAVGLALRPLADTARDTLAWQRATVDAPVTGIDREREAEVLAAWSAAQA